MYLLDTDILSNLMRRTPSTTLISKLASIPPEEQCTSAINLGELLYGAYRLGRTSKVLLEALEKRLLPNLPIIPFDTEAAYQYGRTRAELERLGIVIGDADLRIAAIALSRGITVVSGNTRHFRSIPGLQTENWLEP